MCCRQETDDKVPDFWNKYRETTGRKKRAEINRLLALSNGDIVVHSTIKLLSSHGLNEKPCQCKLAVFQLTNKGCCGSTTVP